MSNMFIVNNSIIPAIIFATGLILTQISNYSVPFRNTEDKINKNLYRLAKDIAKEFLVISVTGLLMWSTMFTARAY